MNSHDDDINPAEPPPSYEEVIKESTSGSYSRPNPHHLNHHGRSLLDHPSHQDLQVHLIRGITHLHNQQRLRRSDPQGRLRIRTRYIPLTIAYHFTIKGFLCQKCRNSGYKVKNGKVCRECWDRFYLKNNAYNLIHNYLLSFQRDICVKSVIIQGTS